MQSVTAVKIQKHFSELGIETPMVQTNNKDKHELKSELSKLYHSVHRAIGLDLNDDSISDTPNRIAKLMVDESFAGLDYDNFPKCTVVENKFFSGAVTVNDITVSSLCEHHWERVIMKVSVSYLPKSNVLGLSKFARIADFFGARPIVQERYTTQLHEALKVILETDDVAVHVRGLHMCMYARGVAEPCSSTTTCLLGGKYGVETALREEFMHSIDVTKPIV